MTSTKDQIMGAVREAIVDVGADPTVPDVDPGTARTVEEKVAAQVGPIVENLTNSEPLWRSKVMIGSLTALLGGGFGLWDLIEAGSRDPGAYAINVAAVIGAGFAIYGRLAATRAIGR